MPVYETDGAKSTRVSRTAAFSKDLDALPLWRNPHSTRAQETSNRCGQVEAEPHFASVVTCSVSGDPMADANHSELSDNLEVIAEARRRLLEAPVDVVVANHAMGLYELGAIHLSAQNPDYQASALAIDALACLVEGLDDRLGENAQALRDALANIRMVFVQVTSATQD